LPGWQAAGKTGTSQDWRDAWFVGYTSHLVTGVWLGNDDGEPTKHVSGGSLPVDIWSRFMRAAHQGVPIAALPLSDWRKPDIAVPVAAAPPPPVALGASASAPAVSAAIGAPLTINKGGEAFSSTPGRRGVTPAASNAPVPPAPIPYAGGAASGPAPGEKNFLNKLLGAI
jgi:penicillin-binding protein 1A